MPWFVSASRVMRYHAPMPMKDYLLLITTDTPDAPRIAFGVRVPMRDGVHLAADVYLPPLVPGEADRWPIILMRTPYLKSSETALDVGALLRQPRLRLRRDGCARARRL